MRILVLGATGYVGSRLVPSLLEAGHRVVAASSSTPDPARFAWGDQVDWVQCDVTSQEAVEAALVDPQPVDAVCYLVHSLSHRGFSDKDRRGAETVRRAVDGSDVRRMVYLSGLVPPVPHERLSMHLASRLEVEEELLRANCSTLALRAGVVIGAGSTSFEVIRQLATLLLVQPVPRWLRSKVQPIAVTDCVRALVESFSSAGLGERTGSVDIGGPDVIAYPRLMARLNRRARLLRVPFPLLVAPAGLVALGTAGLVQAPFHTVASLVASLRDDMVCRPEVTWTPADGAPLIGLDDAMDRALDRTGGTLEAGLPSDPAWTRQSLGTADDVARALGLALPVPATVRAGLSLARHRLLSLLAALP